MNFLTYTYLFSLLFSYCATQLFIAEISLTTVKELISFTSNLYKNAVHDNDLSIKQYLTQRYIKQYLPILLTFTKSTTFSQKQLKSLSTDFQDLKDLLTEAISESSFDILSSRTDRLFQYAKDVQYQYERFLEFRNNPNKYQISELESFAEVITSSSLTEMKRIMWKMHEELVDKDILTKENLVSIIAQKSSDSDTLCLQAISPQQLIYKLFEMVAYTHTKALMVILYCYDFKEANENVTYQQSKEKENLSYARRMETTFDQVKLAMSEASKEILRCDPKRHEIDETYEKLEEPFQGYLVSEFDLTRSKLSSLLKSCASVNNEKLKCRTQACKDQPQKKTCTGRMRNCQVISRNISICHAPIYSDRRYNWMKTDNGDIFGNYGFCYNNQNFSENIVSFFHYCFCTCENIKLDIARHFSLMDVLSDVEENKVITGVRLVKQNHVFYIQIQQGKLSNNGSINGTVNWKDIEEVPITSYLSNQSITLEEIEKEMARYVYSVNFNQTTVLLDNVYIKSTNIIMTGLRFRKTGTDLMLEIKVTKFDYDTGKLDLDNYAWMNAGSEVKYRQEVDLGDRLNPVTLKRSVYYSDDNQFVRFNATDYRTDLAQYTVPFIDIQEVVTNPPMPLAGAGLYHKGRKNSGGFLGIKIMHFDYTFH